jgi:hypothetical protein
MESHRLQLPEHIQRLRAPLQVWDYIAYLQRENARLNALVDQAVRDSPYWPGTRLSAAPSAHETEHRGTPWKR